MTPQPFMDLLIPLAMPQMVIWADQNGDRPPKPYWTLKVRSSEAPPLVEGRPDASGNAIFHEHRMLQVEIGCFGLDAVELAQTMAMRLRAPSQLSSAERLGLSISRVDRVRDLTMLLNQSQYEQRAMLELTAYAVGTLTEQVGLIEHAVLNCPTAGSEHQHVISSPTAATPPPSA